RHLLRQRLSTTLLLGNLLLELQESSSGGGGFELYFLQSLGGAITLRILRRKPALQRSDLLADRLERLFLVTLAVCRAKARHAGEGERRRREERPFRHRTHWESESSRQVGKAPTRLPQACVTNPLREQRAIGATAAKRE